MELLMAPFETLRKGLKTWYNCYNTSCPKLPCSPLIGYLSLLVPTY